MVVSPEIAARLHMSPRAAYHYLRRSELVGRASETGAPRLGRVSRGRHMKWVGATCGPQPMIEGGN